ncbi:MAG: tetratricopeptide repeat protein [Chloroflexota bacterium]
MNSLTNLIPSFILEQQCVGKTSGYFSAVALFIDISGFSTVTNTLATHGSEAAEAMADIMLSIFDPLVESIYAHGGFITTFAGDAFTALFPLSEHSTKRDDCNNHDGDNHDGDNHDRTAGPYHQALAAAVTIQQYVATNPIQVTSYGQFRFDVKLGLAAGAVAWGILSPSDDSHAETQSAYYFRGPAIDGAAGAEHHAHPGDMILTVDVHKMLRDHIDASPVDDAHVRVGEITGQLVDAQSLPAPEVYPGQETFIPQALLAKESRGEFRQVVSVFVNLRDIDTADDLARFIQTVFGLQADYGGFLARVDFGDKGANLLLFWGMPTSYENDIDNALRFMHKLEDVAPSVYKAGVTYRFMYAGLAGSARRGEYTAYGGGVGHAARLMVKAPWGSVWLDEQVVQYAGKQFVIAKEGEYEFKGFAKPQPTYSLVGQQEVDLADFYEGKMIGRQRELAQLEAFIDPLLDAQREKRFAGVLVVEGEAGLGKSRLVTEFLTSAKAEACQYIVTQTDQTVRSPFNPFRYWLRNYFEQSSTYDDVRNKHHFARQLDQLIVFLESDSATLTQPLIKNLTYGRSFLGALVGLHWENSPYENLEGAGRYEWTITALKSLILAESLRQPLLFNLEDIHWLDSESMRMMERLVYQVDGYPLAILATARPTTRSATHLTAGNKPLLGEIQYETINLALMSAVDLTQLAQSILGAPIHDALAILLQNRAEGNPFFAEQIVRYLQGKGEIEEQGGQWVLVGETLGTTLPTDVRTIFTARLDQLTSEIKRVVQTAAILGREFEAQILTRILQDDETLPIKLATAEQEAIWTMLTQPRYLFKHSLLRDAAYDMQLRAQRRILHCMAAQVMEYLQGEPTSEKRYDYAYEIALHYEFAYQQGLTDMRESAIVWLKNAAEKIAGSYENDTALDLFDKALALIAPEEMTLHYELLLGREKVYDRLGQRDAQTRDLDVLSTLAERRQNPAERSEVAQRQASLAMKMSDYPLAQTLAEQAIAYAQAAGDIGLEASAQFDWGYALYWLRVDDSTQEHYRKALHLARRAKKMDTESLVLRAWGMAVSDQGDYEEAQQYYDRSLAITQESADRPGEGHSLNCLAALAFDQGDHEKAQQLYERSLAIMQEIGDRYGEEIALNNLGNVALTSAHYERAQQLYHESLFIAQEVGHKSGEANMHYNLGMLSNILGKDEKAHHHFLVSLQTSREVGDLEDELLALYGLAFVDISQGNYEAARIRLENANVMAEEAGSGYWQAYCLTRLGQVAGYLGAHEVAETHVRKAIIQRRELGHEALLAESQSVLAELYFQRRDFAKAQEAITEVYAYWKKNGNFIGAEFPLQIRWICYQILQTQEIDSSGPSAQSVRFLQQAYYDLQEQAHKLHDETTRQSFLENVSWHRAIIAAFKNHQLSGKIPLCSSN